MKNLLFLETFTSFKGYQRRSTLEIPLESLIAYYVYEYCEPADIELYFVTTNSDNPDARLQCSGIDVNFIASGDIPWQVASCLYPVVLYGDTIITGVCAVSRHICKHRSSTKCSKEHDEGLLSFRKSCLQAPNEASIWTKFCEIDILKSVRDLMNTNKLSEIPINLIRFENHLKKPVKVHNVFKLARDLNKIKLHSEYQIKSNEEKKAFRSEDRVPKQRHWKSNMTKNNKGNCPIKKEDLDISHKFSEGPFLTLADLILLPSYHIIIKIFKEAKFRDLFPLTYKWYTNILAIPEVKKLQCLLHLSKFNSLEINNLTLPETDDVSLYKSDTKRHNPRKRIFTKPEDIESALNELQTGIELEVCNIEYESKVNWDEIPDGANPFAGHLPDTRNMRKSQQLENLTLTVLKMAKDDDVIVDFCSGSGHLGILIAYLLPKTTVILLENKEQSLIRARERVHDMGLQNVFFFQCNLDFFIGKFDIGIALHACGIASDLVLDKCIIANAKFVICPCCYGSLHETDRLVYPRSMKFKCLNITQYLCIGHTADQTHKDHPLTVRGERCMAIIDSDRGRLAQQFGYNVTLSRLKPLSCTDKNNLLIGIPTT